MHTWSYTEYLVAYYIWKYGTTLLNRNIYVICRRLGMSVGSMESAIRRYETISQGNRVPFVSRLQYQICDEYHFESEIHVRNEILPYI